jgi:5'-nucleotidase
MTDYFRHEESLSSSPLAKGPLGDLLRKVSFFQKKELKKSLSDSSYKPILKTSIVTARNAPAHERVVTTLKNWDIDVDQVFFLGGIEKARILNILKPHLFFDDQMLHLEHLVDIPAVHIPFGIANKSQGGDAVEGAKENNTSICHRIQRIF